MYARRNCHRLVGRRHNRIVRGLINRRPRVVDRAAVGRARRAEISRHGHSPGCFHPIAVHTHDYLRPAVEPVLLCLLAHPFLGDLRHVVVRHRPRPLPDKERDGERALVVDDVRELQGVAAAFDHATRQGDARADLVFGRLG